jgi:hypothetical protein
MCFLFAFFFFVGLVQQSWLTLNLFIMVEKCLDFGFSLLFGVASKNLSMTNKIATD